MVSCVALIPARSGSKRVAHKNIKPLGGHPLLAYAVRSAIESGVFEDVIVSTDSEEYAAIARHYGAGVVMRPPEFASDMSPDFEWVNYTMQCRDGWGLHLTAYDAFSILRPTSPFRTAATIRRAWAQFVDGGERFDSLRAVERCKQHPGKMWIRNGDEIAPFWAGETPRGAQPWHSSPTQSLPPVLAQNASLEIAWTRVITEHGNISGDRVMPFFTEGYEGLDINDERDWWYAEHLVCTGQATLPEVHLG